MSTWPFHRLNELPASIDTPFGEFSPLSSGGFDNTLSMGVLTPLSGFALDAQLEVFQNIQFNFDGADFGGASMGYDGFFPALEEEGGECVGEERGRYYGGRDRESMVKCGNREGSSFQGLPAREPHGGSQYPFGIEDLGMMSYVDQVLAVADGVTATSPLGTASLPSPSPSLSPPETDLPFVAPTFTRGKRRHTLDTPLDSSIEESPSPLVLDASPKSDKRARNTAASARFRTKKKQRAAALESTLQELEARVAEVADEVDTLRTENLWLRSLVTGKPGKRLHWERTEGGGTIPLMM